jgi:Lipocalin-like domain
MLRDDILGTWELVSYTAQDNHGGPITYPLGPDALGLIMYTGDGYMSAQIMRRDRPAFDRPETDGAPPNRPRPPPTGPRPPRTPGDPSTPRSPSSPVPC